MRTLIPPSMLGTVLLLSALSASAVPTAVVAEDTPECDLLSVPTQVHELGNGPSSQLFPGPFPQEEAINSFLNLTGQTACSPALGQTQNLVVIENRTGIAWSDVWYVADPETTITNADGRVNGMLAFKIDAVGVNVPLVDEFLTSDGIFEDGEVWQFILQDYATTAGASSYRFGSIGVPSSGSADGSGGSIIAIPVPEPASAALIGIGLLGLAGWRRVRA